MERLEKRGQGLENFKKYNFVFYIIILFITILATFPFYRGNFHAGNDFAFNYARVMSTISALKDGQVIPQFDPNALSGFGYAWNEFYGPLPTYFISVIKFIVKSWSLSFALFYSLCLFISGVLIFNFSSFLLKDHTNSKLFGLLAVALFTFSNSTYINLYYYANPSQPLALLVVILLFWGMTKMFNKRSFAAFVLLYLLFLLIKKGNLKEKIKIIDLGFLSVISAIGLSAFFLFPLLENLTSGIYNVSNSDFSRSFGWNNIAYFQGKWEPLYKIEFSYYKFPSLLFVFIVLFIFIFSLINFKKTNAKYSLIFSCFSLVLVLMQLPMFPWKLFSVFTIVQDPARFSTLFGLFSALSLVLILPILLDKISGKTSYYLTISLLVIFSILGFTEFRNRIQKGSQPLFASAQSLLNKTPFNYMENPDSIAIGEYLPQVIGSHNQPYEKTIQQFYKDKNVYGMRNQAMTYLSQRGKLPEGLAKSIQISDYSKKGSHVTFTATTGSKSAGVEIPEIYYKGFIAFTKEENKKIKLTSQISKNGFLEIKVPAKFSGKIYSCFAMSSATKYGGLLSLLTFVSLLIILSTKTFRKSKLSKDK
ncbi:hypothetical protein [Lactococcus cremoris]|uniref:hypothetical protein n=1 Tax=Lactococcus lactis subsp. cremoris TaxID=1359 RepID=UPI002208AFB4|nr:hypothetical protein [Lactococcus cremoris]UXV61727.1 hypothetical protein LLUC073_04475 [Lactococcus cremoris]